MDGLRSACPHWKVAAVIAATFALFSLLRAPVPAVNEPHYLCKARHFYEPTFAQGDLFLESHNTHWFFYATVGPATQAFSFETTAWLGRFLGASAVALALTALLGRLTGGHSHADPPAKFSSAVVIVRTAWLWLLLTDSCNLSGEWVIRGFESKVPAYACLFLALAWGQSRQSPGAAAMLGLAIAWHPVVGVWGTAALLGAELMTRARTRDFSVRWGLLVGQVALTAVLAAPGLIPALGMLTSGGSPEIQAQADNIQVFDRLRHHLDPRAFPLASYVRAGCLLGLWGALRRCVPRSPAWSGIERFTICCVLLAIGGGLFGWFVRQPGLMKFYPFRLFDVFVPLVAAYSLACFAERLPASVFRNSRLASRVLTGVLAVVLLVSAALWPRPDRRPTPMNQTQLADWQEACRWISRETPPRAVFLTPDYSWAFKWYAERAEYYCRKDSPQDAKSLVEWSRRGKWSRAWWNRHRLSNFEPPALAELRAATPVRYVIVGRGVFKSGRVLHQNRTFEVRRLD